MTDATPEAIITTPAQLKGLVDHLRAIGRFAFDTEFVTEETFEPVLCLIQVATRERLAVIDPLAVRDVEPVLGRGSRPVDRGRHARGRRRPEDLPAANRAAAPARIRRPDRRGTGRAQLSAVAREPGRPGAGDQPGRQRDAHRLAASAAQSRPSSITRSTTFGTCSTSPITSPNAWLTWAERPGPRPSLPTFSSRSPSGPTKTAGGGCRDCTSSSRRGLEMARRLAEWREDEARRQNRPLRQVVRDDLLVAIAKRQPTNRRDLEALRDFNRPALLSRSQEILGVLDEARAVPEDQLPELAARPEEPPGLSTVTNLLSAALAQCCAQNQIAGSLVANVADLKHLVRWHLDGRDHSHRPALLEGWRGELCGTLLLDVLEGRLALRVVDPESEFPVALEQIRPEAPRESD